MKDWQNKIREIGQALLIYLKQPVTEIKHLPDWSWPRLIAVHVSMTALVSLISVLTEQLRDFSFSGLILGTILRSFLTLITTTLVTVFFFYSIQIALSRVLAFRKLFLTVFFSFLPFLVFQIFHEFFPPITLLGFLFTAFLLVIGLTENLEVPKTLSIRLSIGMCAIFMLIWITGRRPSNDIGQFQKSETKSAPEVQLGPPSQ